MLNWKTGWMQQNYNCDESLNSQFLSVKSEDATPIYSKTETILFILLSCLYCYNQLTSAYPYLAVTKDGHLMVFPIQKCGFLPKVKEIKRLCGGEVYYAAQARAQIDSEIGLKDHL